MNNVKTNRTMENAWANTDGTHWSTKEMFYRGWRSCLESVVQEPALTRETISDYLDKIESLTGYLSIWSLKGGYDVPREVPAVIEESVEWCKEQREAIEAGRIPAPATVETPADEGHTYEDGVKEGWRQAENEAAFQRSVAAAPQEDELTREWLRMNLPDKPMAVAWIVELHNQALSAREQAVRTRYAEALVDLEKRFHALTLELAAEKLANEGKYAPSPFAPRKWLDCVMRDMECTEMRATHLYARLYDDGLLLPSPALTPDEKAEAFVKWWCTSQDGEQLDAVEGWKELATRQANGETIAQIYAEVKP